MDPSVIEVALATECPGCEGTGILTALETMVPDRWCLCCGGSGRERTVRRLNEPGRYEDRTIEPWPAVSVIVAPPYLSEDNG